jgi:DNA polymerase
MALLYPIVAGVRACWPPLGGRRRPMADRWSAAPFVPASRQLDVLATAAARCEGCPLHRDATQVVFGEGPASASLVLVGEQPGDREDVAGVPFVGPAGAVLWRCVDEAGIPRDEVYATNAVKHFKHERVGARRLHKKPGVREVEACHPWLEAELEAVTAPVVVALGATAARALLGRAVGIADARGRSFELGRRQVRVTYHPSAVLRADERARELRAALVHDLVSAWELAAAA